MREPERRFGRSELELLGPRSSLSIGPRSARGERSAPLPSQIPHPPANTGIEGFCSREPAKSKAPIRHPPIRDLR
eukprot:15440971-Alexandrium_andersonii.AAC.1